MPVLLKTFVRKSIFNEVRDFIHHNHNGKDVIDTKPNINAIKLSIIKSFLKIIRRNGSTF